jgi:carboxymethylenebutenolidase
MLHDPRPGHYIDLTASDGQHVRSFVALPSTPALGALVLLQHMDQREPPVSGSSNRPPPLPGSRPGITPHIRQMAEGFAAAGYLAIAPSTFNRGVSGIDYGYRFQASPWGPRLARPLTPLPSEVVMLDIQAALVHTRRVAPFARIGVVGYCWGGLLAWQAACRLPAISAAVCHYGGGMEHEVERLREPACPVLAHFPSDERWVSSQGLQTFRTRHSADAIDAPSMTSVRIHPGRYGFMQPQHEAFDLALSDQVHSETLEFLARHLQGPPVEHGGGLPG